MGSTQTKYNKDTVNIYIGEKRVAYGKYTHGPYFPHMHLPPMLATYVNSRPDADFYYIYNINVVPEYRRKRLCRKIIKMLLDKILQQSPDAHILLHIRHLPGNIPPFKKCYEKEGFRYQFTENDPIHPGKVISLFSHSL